MNIGKSILYALLLMTVAVACEAQTVNRTVTASWNASPTVATNLGYNVYRSTASAGPFTRLNTALVAALTYSDTTVAGGTTYWYRITSACPTTGCTNTGGTVVAVGESTPTASSQAIVPADPSTPGAPSGTVTVTVVVNVTP